MKPDISVIVVTYNSARDITACLTSAEKRLGSRLHEIIVVDNASDDATVALITRSFDNVRLIKNTQNVGFGKAVNRAAAMARGDMLLLLNPDAEILRWHDAVADMIGENDTVILGGMMTSFNGKVQGTSGYAPSWKTELFHALRLHYLFPFGRYVIKKRFYRHAGPRDWVSGGLMLIDRSAWKKLGGFDERFFMYMEDVDLCVRAHAMGYAVRYDPSIVARHRLMGSTTSLSVTHQYYFASLRAYFDKHRPTDRLAKFFIGLLEKTS